MSLVHWSLGIWDISISQPFHDCEKIFYSKRKVALTVSFFIFRKFKIILFGTLEIKNAWHHDQLILKVRTHFFFFLSFKKISLRNQDFHHKTSISSPSVVGNKLYSTKVKTNCGNTMSWYPSWNSIFHFFLHISKSQ